MLQRLDFLLDPGGAGERSFTGLCRAKSALDALEQPGSQGGLGGAQPARHGRLVHAEPPGGGRERAGPGDRQQNAKVAPFHRLHFYRSRWHQY